ncbi:macro domain-containing protein [Vibrio splendidus]|nr:macro domain-containing protein [Vibrio splendidus]MCC4883118.1 macro domain-containing protein [Vibrio splendidus]
MFNPSVGYCDAGSFAGIGSRRISYLIAVKHAEFAFCMTLFGYMNNTGGADGMDTATEFGTKLAYDFLAEQYGLPAHDYGRVLNCFLPWSGFNGRTVGSGYIVPKLTDELTILASSHHPGWDYLKDPAKNMMRRNGCQVLGLDLQRRVNFVSCHTPDGAMTEAKTSGKTGGTGQAIRIADRRGIKVYNTGDDEMAVSFDSRLANARSQILEHFGIDSHKYVKEKYFGHQPFSKVVTGDFVQAMINKEYDILIHGCNCQNAMGSGFAEKIKKELNEAYQADMRTTKGDKSKLGTFTHANITRGDANFVVVNAYTQFKWSREPKLHCDYDAIRKSLKAINAQFPKGRILIPRIGSGLANGCWVTVSNIIKTEFKGRDVTIIQKDEREYVPEKKVEVEAQLGLF